VIYGHGNDSTKVDMTLISSTQLSEITRVEIEPTLNDGYGGDYLEQLNKVLKEEADDFRHGGWYSEQNSFGTEKRVLILGGRLPEEQQFSDSQLFVSRKQFVPLTSAEVKDIAWRATEIFWINPTDGRFMKYYPDCPLLPQFFEGGALWEGNEEDGYILLNGASQAQIDELIRQNVESYEEDADTELIPKDEALKIFEKANRDRDLSDIFVYFPDRDQIFPTLIVCQEFPLTKQ
jgi:hypothetical protein